MRIYNSHVTASEGVWINQLYILSERMVVANKVITNVVDASVMIADMVVTKVVIAIR